MKKTRNTSTKVIAISSIAVVALAGVSIVSLHSLAKTDEAARVGSVSGLENADTASGKLGTRPEQAVVVVPVAQNNEAADMAADVVYSTPVDEIVAVDTELVVVSSNVVEEEQKANPEEMPVIAVAQVAEAKEEVKEEAVLAVQNTEPVFLQPEVVEETVNEEIEEYIPELNVVDSNVEDNEWGYEAQNYEEPVYQEPVNAEPVYTEPVLEEVVSQEPVYTEPVYEEPDYAEPEYVPEVTVDEMEYVPEATVEPTEDNSSESTSTVPSSVRQQLVDYAASRVGVTPYVWAGRSLETGTDCSGFVNLIYDNFGYYASAGSDDYQNVQGDWGTNISYDELQIGDVVVYYDGGHVGIYAGQDEYGQDLVIHDSNEVEGVKVSEMNYSNPTAFVRIIDDAEYVDDTSSYTGYDSSEDYDDNSYDDSENWGNWDDDWNDWE